MSAPGRILVATDLAVAGDAAIEAAHAWCQARGGVMVITHVVATPDTDGDDHSIALAPFVDRVEERVRAVTGKEPGTYEVRVVEGKAADTVLAVATEVSADMIVLGGREPGGKRWIFGSVAERVVTHAAVPVLVARPHAGSGHIVAGTDFSEPSLPAVRAAHEAARATHGKVTIVHVVEPSTAHYSAIGTMTNVSGGDPAQIAIARAKLRALCEESPEQDSARIVVGNPAEQLLAVAAEVDASLVVVASRGRSGLARFVMGSVAGRVVRDAPCSVLVVRLHA